MGLCFLKGLTEEEGRRILAARRAAPFQTIAELIDRARLPVDMQNRLAAAGAEGASRVCEASGPLSPRPPCVRSRP
ncbi:MAG: hypothetical protein IH825_00980 [Candidatus Marinimicrobia bacterium]|nr:hypothetical protein [Candidatus Neomarinimicrobiota bacterium]